MLPATIPPRRALGLSICFALLPLVAAAQSGPAPVRYTEARTTELRDTVRLPGDVQSHVEALLATEVAGLVIELPAREGTRVRQGDVIAKLRSDALELQRDAARGQRTEAQARLDRAERQLGRARDLIASDAIAPEQLDDAVSDYDAWRGRLQQLDAQISRIELDIERCTIRALFDGVVVEERAEVGEWIGEGSAVVRLLSLDEFEVRVDVPERFFGALRANAAVQVTFESLPELVEQARISAIIPRAVENSRTFPVELALEQPDPRIGVGMLAGVEMPVGDPRQAVVVPKDAVVSGPQGRAVWVIDDDVVRSVAVTLGNSLGVWTSVTGDLQPGDKVVVRGNERLRPQQAVRGEAMEYELP